MAATSPVQMEVGGGGGGDWVEGGNRLYLAYLRGRCKNKRLHRLVLSFSLAFSPRSLGGTGAGCGTLWRACVKSFWVHTSKNISQERGIWCLLKMTVVCQETRNKQHPDAFSFSNMKWQDASSGTLSHFWYSTAAAPF